MSFRLRLEHGPIEAPPYAFVCAVRALYLRLRRVQNTSNAYAPSNPGMARNGGLPVAVRRASTRMCVSAIPTCAQHVTKGPSGRHLRDVGLREGTSGRRATIILSLTQHSVCGARRVASRPSVRIVTHVVLRIHVHTHTRSHTAGVCACVWRHRHARRDPYLRTRHVHAWTRASRS